MGVTVPKPVLTEDILTTSKTDYCGNIIYEDGVLSKILTEEGYITFSGSNAVFHYYLKDHEGNNRVVLNQNGTVEQVNHYYPFGGLFGDNTGGSVQPYMYNGKELDRMHGLDLFDYGARHYDAALGRWFTMDPHAENYYSVSPYTYCGNNPINITDPTGMNWYEGIDKDGHKTGETKWIEGNREVDGYTNIGDKYVEQLDRHTSFTYGNSTDPISMTITTLFPEDFCSQMKSDGSGKKDGQEGNCFFQSGKMVAKSGAESIDDKDQNISEPEDQVSYIENQSNLLRSVRIHVDKNHDGKGDHWVSSSSITIDLQTQTVSKIGFFDPATKNRDNGTKNSFIVSRNFSMTGKTAYNRKFIYNVVHVRNNKK